MHVAVNAHLLGVESGYRRAGVSTYIEQLLRHFWRAPDARDVRWTVFVPRGVSHASLAAPASATFRHARLPTSSPVPRIFWEQFVAPARLAWPPPDVLLCPLNVIPLLAPCPAVVTVLDLAFFRYPLHRPYKNAYLRAMTRVSVRQASHVITISEFVRQEVIDVIGVRPDRVTAIPLAHDERFRPVPAADVERFRATAGLPPRFLLSVGTQEPRKNLATLLRAYAAVRDRIGRIPLVLVGGRGWGFDEVVREIDALGLRDDVRMTGYVSPVELPLYYAAATAFVYPSLYEGFGLPPLEAMGVGTPVIVSTADSLREVGGDAVVCVPPLDVGALADAIVRVATDEPFRQSLLARGLRRSDQFSWQRVADRTLDVLRGVAGGGTKPAAAAPRPSGPPTVVASPAAVAPAAVAPAAVASRPLRVLYVGHTGKLGGAEIALWQLLRNVDRRRVDPTVLLFSDGPLAARLRQDGVRHHLLRLASSVIDARKDLLGLSSLARLDDVAACLRHVIRLAGFIHSGRFDLVHTNTLKAHVLGGLAARLAGRPLVWHVRERIADDYLPGAVAVAFRRLARALPDRLIVNSEATRQALLALDAADPQPAEVPLADKCKVISDGTDTDRFRPTTGTAASAGPGALIGMIGRLSPLKGQDVFLRAAAAILETHPNARFALVGAALFGEQPYERSVRALARQLGVEHAVDFRGFRDDVAAEMARLDVFVHASVLPEPFGQVIIEAMAAGKPVVATDGGGVPEIVEDGRTGLLVPMGDAVAMAAAVRLLLDDPPRGRTLAAAARAHVCDRFSIGATARKVEQFYAAHLGTDASAEPRPRPRLPGKWAVAAVATMVGGGVRRMMGVAAAAIVLRDATVDLFH